MRQVLGDAIRQKRFQRGNKGKHERAHHQRPGSLEKRCSARRRQQRRERQGRRGRIGGAADRGSEGDIGDQQFPDLEQDYPEDQHDQHHRHALCPSADDDDRDGDGEAEERSGETLGVDPCSVAGLPSHRAVEKLNQLLKDHQHRHAVDEAGQHRVWRALDDPLQPQNAEQHLPDAGKETAQRHRVDDHQGMPGKIRVP